jgi:hypothetical protein
MSSTSTPRRRRKRAPSLRVGRVRAFAIRGPDRHGRLYWQAVTRVGRRRVTVWTGWTETPEAAERKVAAYVAQGSVGARTTVLGPNAGTVAVLLAEFRARVTTTSASLRPSTISRYVQALETLVRLLGAHGLEDVTTQLIDRYIAARVSDGVAVCYRRPVSA